MNVKDSIVAVVKEVIADAEKSGVVQLVQSEVTKLETELKAYIDAKIEEAFASITKPAA